MDCIASARISLASNATLVDGLSIASWRLLRVISHQRTESDRVAVPLRLRARTPQGLMSDVTPTVLASSTAAVVVLAGVTAMISLNVCMGGGKNVTVLLRQVQTLRKKASTDGAQ